MNIKRIKEICLMGSNEGLNENEYRVYDHLTDMLEEAWAEWSDDITTPFWEGEKKPEYYTESFRSDYYNNIDWEEDFKTFI